MHRAPGTSFAPEAADLAPASAPPVGPLRLPAAAPAVDTRRDQTTLFILSLLLGNYGVDRFYSGHIVLGIVKLLTHGGCGVWWLIDVVLAGSGSFRDADGRLPRPQYEHEPRSDCSQSTAFVLSIFALDRFYLGQFGLGLLKVLTLGGFGVWWIIDIILTGCGLARDDRGRPLSVG